jgi:hypothetical protein
MKRRSIRAILAVALAVVLASASSAHAASAGTAIGSESPGLPDPPSAFFPGKYFEWKAQEYLRFKHYDAALDMFRLSGFWADKMSQYNVGIMLFNGIGVPVDRPSGVAWLRIAAESKQDLPVATFNAALAELDEGERAEATKLWHALDEKYGNAAALPRAINRFVMAKHGMSNFGIPDPNLFVAEAGTDTFAVPSTKFLDQKNAELESLIKEITGEVKVGAVTTITINDDAKQNASKTVVVPDTR